LCYCYQGGASGGGAAKAVKTDELDIDIEKEARGHRVRQMLLFICSIIQHSYYGIRITYVMLK